MQYARRQILGLWMGLGLAASPLDAASPDTADTAFDDDIERLLAINEGELEFLPGPAPPDGELITRSQMRILPQSLADGWIELQQCQEGLDAISTAEILYNYEGLRGLVITEQTNIGSAWVEGKTVQLRDVQAGARVCIAAQIQILRAAADGRYEIRSGPYHRRFLDGYFPMQLFLSIRFPAALLNWVAIDPPEQPGLSVQPDADGVAIETRFAGKLVLHFSFIDNSR